tara:strand:- start:465 stop:932 length:468 start_codon:yes stop_codon:yes gene_type:complete
MAGSIELRVPFLDHKIVEFAAQIPDKYKIKWTTNSKKIRMCMISDSISENYDIPKYILRKSFDKILPKKIINRKKIGFPVPMHQLINKKKLNFIKEIIFDEKIKKHRLFNFDYVSKMIDNEKINNFSKGAAVYQKSNANKIWMILNISLFLEKYL